MESQHELIELLKKIELSNRKQLRCCKIQFILTAVASICCVALLLCLFTLFPQLEQAVSQAEIILNNLETVTTELADADLIGMVENVDHLVVDVNGLVNASQSGVEQTMEKINKIDFERLNQAIKDLSDVIEPVANFFNRLK